MSSLNPTGSSPAKRGRGTMQSMVEGACGGRPSGSPGSSPGSPPPPQTGEERFEQGLPHRVMHELLRRRAAPRAGELVAADQVGGHAGVEHVGVGPMLVHPAPRVAPVVVDLAAERMPAEPPEMLVALFLEMLV